MTSDINPQIYARVGGTVYLLIIALGIVQEAFIRGRITLTNLKSMELLWRAGIAMELLVLILNVVLALALYVLTRPVHKELALLALLFNAIATAVEGAYVMQLVEALFPLGTSAHLTAFTPAQLQAMSALSMKSHVIGFGIALLLFGPYFFVTGYLVAKSRYLPKPLGVLYQLAGLAYIFNGLALVLAPQLAGRVFTVIAGPAFIGETSFALWLVIKGVQMERWTQMNTATVQVAV